ncbi:MAG: hypothetical protein HN521_16380 [Candidatus Latescibacteria bacterium]|nr:hypothetical protein [Candidatus Latescibacterota bacterium]
MASAQDRPARVQLDCREGIGLLPNMWRGMTLQTGDLPEQMTLRTVSLGPEPVSHAWTMWRRGGSYDWKPLDRALDQLQARRVEVVLVLPVSQYEDVHWTELVTETVRHVGKRVSLFEFRASDNADLERYLEYYETGVWAVHQLGLNVHVGGPGLDWASEGVEALIRRSSERNLPFHTVTWQVSVQDADDLRRSIDVVSQLTNQYPLDRMPNHLITRWDAEQSDFGVGMSALMRVMTTDVRAICLADTTDVAGWTAMKGLNPLSGVRLPVVIQAPDGDVSGVAQLDHDTVLAIFWHAREDGKTPITLTFSGLPLGDRVRVEQLRLTGENDHLKPVFSETRPTSEPMSVDFVLTGDAVTAVRLVVE